MKIYFAGAQKALSNEVLVNIRDNRVQFQLESYFYVKSNIEKVKEIINNYEKGVKNEEK